MGFIPLLAQIRFILTAPKIFKHFHKYYVFREDNAFSFNSIWAGNIRSVGLRLLFAVLIIVLSFPSDSLNVQRLILMPGCKGTSETTYKHIS